MLHCGGSFVRSPLRLKVSQPPRLPECSPNVWDINNSSCLCSFLEEAAPACHRHVQPLPFPHGVWGPQGPSGSPGADPLGHHNDVTDAG